MKVTKANDRQSKQVRNPQGLGKKIENHGAAGSGDWKNKTLKNIIIKNRGTIFPHRIKSFSGEYEDNKNQ